jgi:hypothetical protein
MATPIMENVVVIPEPLLSVLISKKIDGIIKRCTENGGDCLMWPVSSTRGKTTTSDGYGRVKLTYPGFPRSTVETTVHRAIFILMERRPDLIKNKPAGDISHLCHRKRCVRREHLVLESHTANMLRNECQVLEKCQCGQSPLCIVSKSEA